MSNSAVRHGNYFSRSSAAAEAATDGYNINKPWTIRPQIKEEGRFRNEFYNSFNRSGLASLVEEGMREYYIKSRRELPWNLSGTGAPWWGLPYFNFDLRDGVKNWAEGFEGEGEFYVRENVQNFLKTTGDNPVEYAARFSGWLKVAGGMHGLVRAIDATTTPNGMGSPYTTVNPFHIFDRFPSPHAAERKIWAVRKRANQILKNYGISVSWESLGKVMAGGSRATGKAAVRAANRTLENFLYFYDNMEQEELGEKDRFFFLKAAVGLSEMEEHSMAVQIWAVNSVFSGEYKNLREAFDSSGYLIEDETDGVKLLVDHRKQEVIHGVTVMQGWTVDVSDRDYGQVNSQWILKQKSTGRTYHENSRWSVSTPREAVKSALGAWRRQAELEKANADLVGFLKGDNGFMPLVRFIDSRNSGNCASGTSSYMEKRG